MKTAYSYCPFCGHQYPADQTSSLAQHCPHCQHTYFHNQSSTVCGVIIHKGKLLLAKRGRDPFKGLWDVPGGFVDPTEHPEEAVIREIKEELNLDVTVERLLKVLAPIAYEFQGRLQYNCDHHYLLNVKNFAEIKPADDVVDYHLFDKETLPPLDQCAFDSTKWVVEWYRKIGD